MRFFWLFCALGALLGCRSVSEPSGTAIALFCSTYQGAKTESLTVGEEVAVFACPEGTEDYFLEAAQFIVGSDGRSLTYGETVYYPDPKQAVRFLAYFPYHTGVFSVPTDQSTALALKQADLCGAVASTTPVATPVALEFRHLLARLVITTNEPTEKITFPNAVASGVVHAATAELVLGTVRKDIWTTGNELIVPVQPLSRLLLTVSGVEYVFDTAPIALEAGRTTTLDLTLHPDTHTATLSGSSVTDWVASSIEGNLTQAVSNTLTVHWPKCHPQSNVVNRIVLTIKDEVSGVTANYAVVNGISYANQTFTIPFASSVLHYPYTIVSVALYQANTFLHESMSLLGGTIIKSGACVVGIRQPLNTPKADDYVTIDGLNWARGNLVAVSSTNNRECKVGAPADGGLYFQFGSLIGWKGGNQDNLGTGVGVPIAADGTYWNGEAEWSWANEAMVWPAGLVGTKATWANTTGANIATLNDYYFNYSAAPWAIFGQNIRGFAVPISGDTGAGALAAGRYAPKGVGDPCTYYLGGTWRLPTTLEIASITGVAGADWWVGWTTPGLTGRWATANQTFERVSGPGAWFGAGLESGAGTPTAVNLFFPASGGRSELNGSFGGVVSSGSYWSSSIHAPTHGYNLNIHVSNGPFPQCYSTRSQGFFVRCVSE